MLSTIYQNLGKYDRSVEVAKRAIEMNPNFPPGPANLAWAYLFLERYADAEKTVQQAAERKLNFPDILILPYLISFYKGDRAGMERAACSRNGESRIGGLDDQHGGIRSGLSRSRTASQNNDAPSREMEKQAHQPERAAMYEAGAAVREAFYGNSFRGAPESKGRAGTLEAATRNMALHSQRPSRENAGSQPLASDLEKRFPEDTCVRFTYLPVLRALVALNRGDSTAAIEHLQAAEPYDLATPCSGLAIRESLSGLRPRGGLSRIP